MQYRLLARLLFSLLFLHLPFAHSAKAQEIRTGYAAIQSSQSPIDGLHYFFVGNDVRERLTVGQAIYSAAVGEGGGAIFWGYEAVWSTALSPGLNLTFDGFLGGGGGASVVYGDGRMARVGVGLSKAVSDTTSLESGLSYIDISGTDVSGPVFSFGLAYRPEQDSSTGQREPRLRTVSTRLTRIDTHDSLTRDGNPQPDITLLGAEASFLTLSPGREVYFAADGAIDGSPGYMQIMGGVRERLTYGNIEIFGDIALGFGGGGQVATGGGVLLMAGAGVTLPVSPLFDLEFSLGQTMAPDGDIRGTYGTFRLTRGFQKSRDQQTRPQNWRLSTGISLHRPNSDFRQTGNTFTAWPVMQESSVDMMLSDSFYITGNGQTVLDGDAGGYAVGLLGVGYQIPLHENWTLSLEGHLGAAGGGGINSGRNGLVGSIRAELDYRLSDWWGLSMSVGQIRTLHGSGMAPQFVQIGLKTPFRTR